MNSLKNPIHVIFKLSLKILVSYCGKQEKQDRFYLALTNYAIAGDGFMGTTGQEMDVSVILRTGSLITIFRMAVVLISRMKLNWDNEH